MLYHVIFLPHSPLQKRTSNNIRLRFAFLFTRVMVNTLVRQVISSLKEWKIELLFSDLCSSDALHFSCVRRCHAIKSPVDLFTLKKCRYFLFQRIIHTSRFGSSTCCLSCIVLRKGPIYQFLVDQFITFKDLMSSNAFFSFQLKIFSFSF